MPNLQIETKGNILSLREVFLHKENYLLLESATKQQIEKLFDECIQKYFPEFKGFPKPKFTVFYDYTRSGLYQTRYKWDMERYYRDRTRVSILTSEEIKINRDLFTSPEKLKSVVWHETIHYAEEHTKSSYGGTKLPKWIQGEIDHSGFFKEQMDRINKTEGHDVIFVKDDRLDGQESASEFFVHVFKDSKRQKPLLFWTTKDDKKTMDLVSRIAEVAGITHYYIFPTKNIVFKKAPKLIPSATRWSYAFLNSFDELSPDTIKDIEQNLEKSVVE